LLSADVIKVFTPVKRVPTMIGKAQNGQKIPFGPYTLLQVGGGSVTILLASVCAMTFPINPAITFVAGLIIAAVTVFGLGLIPYTGIRIGSRAMWIGRILAGRKPVAASGMPVSVDSARETVYIDETTVVLLPVGRG
jgi:hypothetical protein